MSAEWLSPNKPGALLRKFLDSVSAWPHVALIHQVSRVWHPGPSYWLWLWKFLVYFFLSFLLPVTSLIAPVCSLTDPSSSMSPLLAEPFRAPSFLPSDLLIFWELVPHFLCPQFNISSVSHIFRPTSTLGLYNPLSPQLWYQSTIAVGFLKIMVNLFILRCLWPR